MFAGKQRFVLRGQPEPRGGCVEKGEEERRGGGARSVGRLLSIASGIRRTLALGKKAPVIPPTCVVCVFVGTGTGISPKGE